MDKKTGVLIAILAPSIIAFGIIKHMIYYSLFEIPITQFIDLDEIIVLFSDDLVEYAIIILTTLIIGVFSSGKTNKIKPKRIFIQYCNAKDPVDRFWIYFKSQLWNFINIGLILLILVLTFIEQDDILPTFKIVILVDLSAYLLRFIVFEYKRKIKLESKLQKRYNDIETLVFF